MRQGANCDLLSAAAAAVRGCRSFSGHLRASGVEDGGDVLQEGPGVFCGCVSEKFEDRNRVNSVSTACGKECLHGVGEAGFWGRGEVDVGGFSR